MSGDDPRHSISRDPVIFSRQNTDHGYDDDEGNEESPDENNGHLNGQNAANYSNDEKAADSFVPPKPSTKSTKTPKGLASMIHQTNADGEHQRSSESEPESKHIPNAEPKAHQTRQTSQDPIHRKGFLSSLCCCFSGPSVAVSQHDEGKPTTNHPTPSNQRVDENSISEGLLSVRIDADRGKKCLVLDLDETLVHSSFQAVPTSDYIIPVTIEGHVHNVFVLKRPWVDEFLRLLEPHYEIVIYTASLDKYANPLLDLLDPLNTIRKRLFRESCVYCDGHYVKDLSRLNRPLEHTIIIDNSSVSFMFQPDNAIDCSSFIDDTSDLELKDIYHFLIAISKVDDVRKHCRNWRGWVAENAHKMVDPIEGGHSEIDMDGNRRNYKEHARNDR